MYKNSAMMDVLCVTAKKKWKKKTNFHIGWQKCLGIGWNATKPLKISLKHFYLHSQMQNTLSRKITSYIVFTV